MTTTDRLPSEIHINGDVAEFLLLFLLQQQKHGYSSAREEKQPTDRKHTEATVQPAEVPQVNALKVTTLKLMWTHTHIHPYNSPHILPASASAV